VEWISPRREGAKGRRMLRRDVVDYGGMKGNWEWKEGNTGTG
jgi:hypothetical protein